MKNIDIDGASDDEVEEAIVGLAYRMGREPYTFYDADGDPWAVLIRADDYSELERKAGELDFLHAFITPSRENAEVPHQELS